MCEPRCSSKPGRASTASSQRHGQSHGQSGLHHRTRISDRTNPEYANPAALGQVEELEALGILSRTEMADDIGADIDNPAYVDGHLLDFSHSQVFSTVSFDQYKDDSLSLMPQDVMNTGMLGAPGDDSLGIMPQMQTDANRFGRGYEADYRNANDQEQMYEPFPQSRRSNNQSYNDSLGLMDQSVLNTGMLGAPGDDSLGTIPEMQMNANRFGRGYEADYRNANDQEQLYEPFPQPNRRTVNPEFYTSTPPPCATGKAPCPGRAQSPYNDSLGTMDHSVMNRGMLGAPAEDSPGIMPQIPMEANRFGRGYEADYNNAQNREPFQQSRPSSGSRGGAQVAIQNTSPPPDLAEVSRALESPSKMTVFDPEILSSVMAPRTTDLNVRRQVLLNSFIRDMNELEQTEEFEIDELLKDFHHRRRVELGMA